jgi:hypothetical protein
MIYRLKLEPQNKKLGGSRILESFVGVLQALRSATADTRRKHPDRERPIQSINRSQIPAPLQVVTANTMDDQAVSSQLFSKTRAVLLTGRPTIYILILLGACVSSYLYKLRVDNIFSCQGSGYTSDTYLAYCDATSYGDYDHGAFWFDLEPAADSSAASADILFLGNSRMQFAFSTAATALWLGSARYYLLGFLDFENSIFARALLEKLKPKAKIYVIAIDDFFEPSERPLAKIIMHAGEGRPRYEVKRFLQSVHAAICGKLTTICGNGVVVFRSREKGTFNMPQTSKFKGLARQVSYDEQIDGHAVDEAIAIGRVFLSELPVKSECVILTSIPTVGTKLRVANAIASGLEKTLTVPEHLDGLQTIEGVHLDHPSAERWSEIFFKSAGPEIQKCLEGHTGGDNLAQSHP